MLHIEERTVINSSPSKIWELLLDFENHSNWNPFIKSINGDAKVGSQLNVEIDNMKFSPIVKVVAPYKELRWIGVVMFNFIFSGEHYFIINEIDDNKCELVHGEYFKGILVPFLKKSLNQNTLAGFKKMNFAIKEKLENQVI